MENARAEKELDGISPSTCIKGPRGPTARSNGCSFLTGAGSARRTWWSGEADTQLPRGESGQSQIIPLGNNDSICLLLVVVVVVVPPRESTGIP